MYRVLTKEQLKKLRFLIIDEVIKNPDIMFSDINRPDEDKPDIIDIIVGMYEYIHQLSTGEQYDYMWHFANKIGGWCDTDYLYQWLERNDKKNEK